MTLATLTMPRKQARPGRPPVRNQPAERRRHIDVAFDRLVRKLSLPQVALLHGISMDTVRRWSRLAVTYDEPEAEGLRRYVEHEPIV